MSRTVAYSAVAVAVACVAVAGGFYGWTETHKETHGTLYWDADVVYDGGRAVELVLDYTLTGDEKEWTVLDVYPLQMEDAVLGTGYYLDPGTHTLRIPCHVAPETWPVQDSFVHPVVPYYPDVDPSTFKVITSAHDVRTDGGRPPAR